MAQKVRVIPATINRTTSAPIDARVKRKVAGYARVSTEQEEQQSSYEAQVSYYTQYIQNRDDWEFLLQIITVHDTEFLNRVGGSSIFPVGTDGIIRIPNSILQDIF